MDIILIISVTVMTAVFMSKVISWQEQKRNMAKLDALYNKITRLNAEKIETTNKLKAQKGIR